MILLHLSLYPIPDAEEFQVHSKEVFGLILPNEKSPGLAWDARGLLLGTVRSYLRFLWTLKDLWSYPKEDCLPLSSVPWRVDPNAGFSRPSDPYPSDQSGTQSFWCSCGKSGPVFLLWGVRGVWNPFLFRNIHRGTKQECSLLAYTARQEWSGPWTTTQECLSHLPF